MTEIVYEAPQDASGKASDAEKNPVLGSQVREREQEDQYDFEYAFDDDPLYEGENNYLDTNYPLVPQEIDLLIQKAILKYGLKDPRPENLAKTWEIFKWEERAYLNRVMPIMDEFNGQARPDPQKPGHYRNNFNRSCSMIQSNGSNSNYSFVGRQVFATTPDHKNFIFVPRHKSIPASATEENWVGCLSFFRKGQRKAYQIRFGHFKVYRWGKNRIKFVHGGIVKTNVMNYLKDGSFQVKFEEIQEHEEGMVFQLDHQAAVATYGYFTKDGNSYAPLKRTIEVNRVNGSRLIIVPNQDLSLCQVTAIKPIGSNQPRNAIESYFCLNKEFKEPVPEKPFIRIDDDSYTWVKNGEGYMLSEAATYKGGFNNRQEFEGQGLFESRYSTQEGIFLEGALSAGRKTTDEYDYEGNFKDGRFHGYGVYCSKPAKISEEPYVEEKFEGLFFRGDYHGYGTLYKDGIESKKGLWEKGSFVKKAKFNEKELKNMEVFEDITEIKAQKPSQEKPKAQNNINRSFSCQISCPQFASSPLLSQYLQSFPDRRPIMVGSLRSKFGQNNLGFTMRSLIRGLKRLI